MTRRRPHEAPAAVVSLAAVAVLVGCGGGDVETPSYDYGLFPNVAYSGHNPGASFKVMFATGAPSPEWAVEDPSVATITPSRPPKIDGAPVSSMSFALVTTTRPGETNVIVRSEGKTLTARLVVKAYSDAELTAGRARYEATSAEPARAPCASCHAKEGGVDHSPLKMAGFDDAVILGVIEQATYPASPSGRSATSDFSPAGPLKLAEHRWNLAGDVETAGILAHLRSLPLGGL